MITNVQKISHAGLDDLLKGFYNLTGLKICVYDADGVEISYYPDRYTSFCGYLRTSPRLDEHCCNCDREAIAQCRASKSALIYTCHIGLTECIAPILIGTVVHGFIVVGQIRSRKDLGTEVPIELDSEKLKSFLDDLPIVNEERIKAALHIAEACAEYDWMKKFVEEKQLSIREKIENFIEENPTADLRVPALCRKFRISHRELYQIFRDSFDKTPADYVRDRRLSFAAAQLVHTDHYVSDIAFDCGIGDYNYFSKVFRKQFGVSPREYRRNMSAKV